MFKRTTTWLPLIRSFRSKRFASSLVKTEIQGDVGIITLCDAQRLNALTASMGHEFVKAVDKMNDAAASQKIRSCIVTGDGEAFSAGGDLEWLRARHDSSPYANRVTMLQFYNLFLHIRTLRVPTIAAINGHAIGAGMCMTLACDFRIAAENARIGFTFVKLGIHPGMGASLLLPRLIAPQKAAEYLLLGSTVTGNVAKADGLVLEAVPKDNVVPRALQLAHELGENAPIAVQTCAQTLRITKFANLDEGLLREANSQAEAYGSKDFLAGLEAIKTKSKPRFNGWE
mmetsp:Transcript_19825/g.28511  ORF Transcript_19825/g.28511 Transcript_19825/m.28511 type:complete len:286 (-) Transcript_19825:61-918(-)